MPLAMEFCADPNTDRRSPAADPRPTACWDLASEFAWREATEGRAPHQNADGAHRRRRWYRRGVKAELELRHLRVLAAVVEAGSYTRAARVLGISQSTVSGPLAGLERALGVTLF